MFPSGDIGADVTRRSAPPRRELVLLHEPKAWDYFKPSQANAEILNRQLSRQGVKRIWFTKWGQAL
jgi:hypothetical protein